MRRELQLPLVVLLLLFLHVSSVAAFDWDPVTDAEKNLTSNPLDPGSGAVVLFKRGRIDVEHPTSSLWQTRFLTYTRIKILTDAGRDAANVELESPKFLRLTKVEGRTILPSGEVVPLDASKVFHTIAYKSGKDFAELATSFAFSSA